MAFEIGFVRVREIVKFSFFLQVDLRIEVPATVCVCAGLFREVRSVPGVPQAGGRWEVDAGAQDRGENSDRKSPV